ncbi:MAG: alcohol dehydrogenase catalytic domain-containing protein [Pseudomonadota bacterium]
MKALYYTGTQEMEIRETDRPEPAPDQTVIRVAFSGICGSDMHAWHGHDPRRVPPLILGHEAVGIAENGPFAGKRVAINPLTVCGSCDACSVGREHLCPDRALIGLKVPGAYAEHVAVTTANLTVLPDLLTDEQAVLAEPLAVCVHAVRLGDKRHGSASKSDKVVVLGGGAIGLLAARVYAHRGVGELWVAEPNPVRRVVLERVLDCEIYDPARSGPPGASVDIVFDAVGSGRTRAAASALVRPGGTIVHTGLQDSLEGLDTRLITLQEVTFVGTYCYVPDDFSAALELLRDGHVMRDGWTEIRPLDAGPQSFQDIHDGRAPPKIILAC